MLLFTVPLLMAAYGRYELLCVLSAVKALDDKVPRINVQGCLTLQV